MLQTVLLCVAYGVIGTLGQVTVDHNTTGPSQKEYEQFVKYLLLGGSELIFSEPLQCLDIDPLKQFYWPLPTVNKGVRICNACRDLPANKLVDMFLDAEPFFEFQATVPDEQYRLAQCFDKCLDLNECIALSFDHTLNMCYLFNTTDGNYKEDKGWTTIIKNQPVEVIEDWVYSRHSKLADVNAYNTINASSFMECLHSCDVDQTVPTSDSCRMLAYDFNTGQCLFFNKTDVDFDYEYGRLTAFHVEATHEADSSNAWRFDEPEDVPAETNATGITFVRNCDKCSEPADFRNGNFYNHQCLTTNLLGCGPSMLGCQLCYYPEVSKDFNQSLPICKNSLFKEIPKLEKELELCFKECITSDICIAIDFSDALECIVITPYNWTPRVKGRRFELSHFRESSIFGKFSWIPDTTLTKFDNIESDALIPELADVTLEQCLSSCLKADCHKVAYEFNKNKCILALHRIGFNSVPRKDSNRPSISMTFFRKPPVNSELFSFQRIPGFQINSSNYIHEMNMVCYGKLCSYSALPSCLAYCLNDLKQSCKYMSVEYNVPVVGINCKFYSLPNDSTLQSFNTQESMTSEIFVRSLGPLTLETLDKIEFFTPGDFDKCFQESNNHRQRNLTDNKNILVDDSTKKAEMNQGPSLVRRKRGFIWGTIKAIGNTASSVGNGIKRGFSQAGSWLKDRVEDGGDLLKKGFEGAKDFTVDTIKDTLESAKDMWDTKMGIERAKNALMRLDFEGAWKEISNTPHFEAAVEAGESFKDLGIAIKEGNTDVIVNELHDLATSKLLDVIPAGKVGKKGVKIGFKLGGKKALKSLVKKGKKIFGKTKKLFRKMEDKFNKLFKKKKRRNGRKGKRNKKCKRRGRRATTLTGKRKKPGSCDKDEDDKKPKCRKPNIKEVLQKSIQACDFVSPGKTCKFECRAGFDEEPDGPLLCKVYKNKKTGKKKARFSPKGKCVELSCKKFPIIPIQADSLKGKITLYVVKFDKKRRLPMWSMAYHDAMNVYLGFKKQTKFYEHTCKELKGVQATKHDYSGDFWDRGHLTPAEPMKISPKASRVINYFINAAPQDSYTNQQPWKMLEKHISCEMKKIEGLVATGICPKSLTEKSLGTTGLDVPSCFWKMICYKDSGKVHVVGFIAPNFRVTSERQRREREKIISIPVSQAEVMKQVPLLAFPQHNPWLQSHRHMLKDSLVRTFKVTASECAGKFDLDTDEAEYWEEKLSGVVKRSRKRRQTRKQRGCSRSEWAEISGGSMTGFSMSALATENPGVVTEATDAEEEVADGTIAAVPHSCGKRVIGYYPSWGKTEFSSNHASRLTHVVYAFLEMKADGSIVVGSADPTHSTNPEQDAATSLERLEQMLKVAARFPHLKLMFAIGGWENSQYFSEVARNPDKRLTFMASVLKIIDLYGFDGVDLDWEYPVTGGAQEGIPDDKQNYILLMQELRLVLSQYQKEQDKTDPYLISFAGAAGAWTLDPGFDLPGLLQYADWVNVMTYDYFGAWESKWGAYTGTPAPLYFAMPPRFSGKTNVHFTIKYYVCHLKNSHQVNMGLPFYGRFWRNVGDLIDPKFDMWRKAEPVNGKFEGGYEPWRNIPGKYLQNPAFKKHFHNGSKTPYAWNPSDRIFLGYEDKRSLKFKIDYAVDKNLGGLMVWAIDQDDSDYTMLDIVTHADLCKNTDPSQINFKCSPLSERRWWIWDEDQTKAGMCGRSAPLYKGYYPLCDPDDPGYSCCGPSGYCGSGPDYCSCQKCKNYAEHPDKLTAEPIKPTQTVQWYLNDAPDGQRGR